MNQGGTFLGAAFEGSPVPQFVLDRNHIVVSWNRAMENFSGIKCSDIIGTDRHWSAFYPYPRTCLADLLIEGKSNSVSEYYRETIRRSPFCHEAYEGIDYFYGENKTGVWLLFTASPLFDESGQIIGAVETLFDLSEGKRVEESLIRVVSKLHLLSGITRHDILNDIMTLSGYVELTRDQIPKSESMEYINRIKKTIKAIEQTISFTRDYQEIGIHSPEWQSIGRTITKAMNSLDTRPVLIEDHLGELEIYADPLLERVFYNLFDNSLRYGIDLTSIRLFTEAQEEDLILVYEDDGGGIPDTEKENIFLRKYYTNSGYGLFLSCEILQITGFSIHERGIAGSGVRFEITIPEGYFRYSGGISKDFSMSEEKNC